MKKDIKAQWVAALRSGEYTQGKQVLHDVTMDTYCCLGVLCDLAVKGGVPVEVHTTIAGGGREFTSYDGIHSMTPWSVKEWAGMSHLNPDVRYSGFIVSLAELNDSFEADFAEIADIIEQQL